MASDDDERRFRKALQHMQEVSQRLTALEVSFQIGEGSGTSHHLPEHDATQHMASHTPTRSTMPTFLGADTGAMTAKKLNSAP